MGYWKDGQFNSAPADWYRDNMNTPYLSSVTGFNGFNVSGEYFAEITDDCGQYQSVNFQVNIVEVPEQPVITVNGDSEVCGGETIELSATDGYNYYRWFVAGSEVGLGTTQTIQATVTGTYTVEVSNVPFDQNCGSVVSNPVYVEIFEFSNIWMPTEVTLCHDSDGIAEITASSLQSDVSYYLVDDATGQVFGNAFAGNGNITFNTAPVTQSTMFNVLAVNNEIDGCEQVLDNQITIYVDEEVYSIYNVENVYDIIEDAAEITTCSQEVSLAIAKGENITPFSYMKTGEKVVWYKDGAVYHVVEGATNQWRSTEIYPVESGVYQAKYFNNNAQDECTYFTQPIEVTVIEKPERPTITYEGSLEFCEGDGELVLTAPTGYDAYNWYRNGTLMANVTSTENEVHVVQSGSYRVAVVNGNTCESERSLEIEAIVHQKPTELPYTVLEDVLCEPGVVTVMLSSGEADVMYQLFDVLTGQPTGAAKMGAANLILQSDIIEADATLEIRAYRLDVESCEAVFTPFEVTVNELEIQVSANTLIAVVNNPADVLSYQWYRNGSIIVNGGDNSTLNIYDDAEYLVVVTMNDGCVLESYINRAVEGENIEDAIATNFEIFPNPATEFVNLLYASENNENLMIRVIDSKGTIIHEVSVNKTEGLFEYQLDLDNWAQGAYIIQVFGKENVLDQMFIKF